MQTKNNVQDQDLLIVNNILKRIENSKKNPLFICIDGRSGVGKSTISKKLSEKIPTTLICSDDFYCNLETEELLSFSVKERYEICLAYRKFIQNVLEPLQTNGQATWSDFRGVNHSARLTDLVIVEGIYCARPELRDFFDLKFLIQMNDSQRKSVLQNREAADTLHNWHQIFDEVEDYYFHHVVSSKDFAEIFNRSI